MIEPAKSHPLCTSCLCYPEGRNDCPDHMKCRAWLGYDKPANGVCLVHGPYGDARCYVCEPHEPFRLPGPPQSRWWKFWA